MLDPNLVLKDVQRLLGIFRSRGDQFADDEQVDDFVDSVDWLDDWLSRGGYLPDKWAKRKVS